jgi:DNA (cytosine-5)-methyltransferase 1
MKFISLFSGIGGFELGLERAGMECVAVCEIDKNAQAVLRRHFPNAEIYNDVREVGKETHERKAIDLICGGFPCQDLSIAGKRAGLAGERSGLWFEFARVIDELEPQWVIIENVPGLLSSNKGRDFAVIIQWLAQRGYGVTWRVLDAQYFGVPQQRRRVFIVGSFGDGRAAEVLFESESGAGSTPPSRETGKEVAYSLRANPSRSGDKGDGGINTTLINTGWDTPAATLRGFGHGWQGQHNDTNAVVVNTLPTIWHNHQQDGSIRVQEDGTVPTVSHQWGTGGNNVPFVGVRRLMPVECERLQGFPDGWTAGQSDSARYRQLGNAVAVPVVEWIGNRIMASNNVRSRGA